MSKRQNTHEEFKKNHSHTHARAVIYLALESWAQTSDVLMHEMYYAVMKNDRVYKTVVYKSTLE